MPELDLHMLGNVSNIRNMKDFINTNADLSKTYLQQVCIQGSSSYGQKNQCLGVEA